MDVLRVSDIAFIGIVSLVSAYHLTQLARRVGQIRMKLKIPYPGITGDLAFMRAFRAQQNTLEFFPVFMICMWLSGIFFHQVPSALLGLVYVYSREIYFKGYCKSVEGRLPGFKLGVRCLIGFLAMSAVGLFTNILRTYSGIDLAEITFGYIGKFFH